MIELESWFRFVLTERALHTSCQSLPYCRAHNRHKTKLKNKMSSSTKPNSKFPVICLHGHGQTGKAFQSKTGAVRSSLKKVCTFHYLDGPFVLSPETKSWVETDFEKEPDTLHDLETELEKTSYRGLEESFRTLAKKINEIKKEEGQHQKVGLVGFSFGAAVIAAFLSKLVQDKDFLAGEESVKLEDVRFVAFFSGFILRSPELTDCQPSKEAHEYFSTNLASYNCFGLGDAVVTPTRPLELASLCRDQTFRIVGDEAEGVDIISPSDAYVLGHKGGHFVPSQAKRSFTEFVRQFV